MGSKFLRLESARIFIVKKIIQIQENIEIQAPAGEVFAILCDPEKHLQLGPDWGKARLSQIKDDYPQPGSSYLLTPVEEDEPAYPTTVTDLDPLQRIAFRVDNETQYQASWQIEERESTLLLSYQAEFTLEIEEIGQEISVEESGDELEAIFNQPDSFKRKIDIAEREARSWLTSIKRYAELRETRLRLWLRWLMDRYILKLRTDQRRVILALLAMQLITCLTFIAAVVGIGLASLIF